MHDEASGKGPTASLRSRLSSMSHRKKVFLTMSIIIISVIGFTAQLTQVATQYFAYSTTTQVELSLPRDIAVHSVSVCVRYNDILDRKRLRNETGIHLKRVQDWMDGEDQESLLTVSQIFEYTPPAEGIIQECMFRDDNWLFYHANASDCDREFQVQRFFTQEYMCYSFVRLHGEDKEQKISFQSVTRSTFYQFVMYEIFLRKDFAPANRINVASFAGAIPYNSRDYSVSFYLDATGKQPHNYIEVLSADYEVQKLKAPYETACTDIPDDDDRSLYRCHSKCVQKSLAKINKVSASLIITDPTTPYTVVGSHDLRNETILSIVKRTMDRCHNRCFYTPCLSWYSKTQALTKRYSDTSLAIASLTPIEPTIRTSAQATMTGIDFFSFVCACFGTWFGFSFLSLGSAFRSLTRSPSREAATIVVHVWDTDRRIKRVLRIP